MQAETSSITHTPGPWKIDGKFDADVAVTIYCGDIETGDWADICELEPLGEEWSEEEIANAHLMRSSPDLLAALQIARATIDALAKVHDPAYEIYMRNAPEIRVIDEALAKAQGRP